MYTYSTSDRFTKIRNTYIPGPGGIEYDSGRQGPGFISPRARGMDRLLNQTTNTSQFQHKKNHSMVMSNRICEKCATSLQATNQGLISPARSKAEQIKDTISQMNKTTTSNSSSIKSKGSMCPSALCDECYCQNFQMIQQERSQLDQEIKQIQDKLSNSLMDEEYSKTKRAIAEEYLVNPNGGFYKPAHSDKNFDPDYTKVPEIGDTKKSYNIASNKYFQTQLLNESLKLFNQSKRRSQKQTPTLNNSSNRFVSPRRLQNDGVSPSGTQKQANQAESQKVTAKMMQIIYERGKRKDPVTIQGNSSNNQEFTTNIKVTPLSNNFAITPISNISNISPTRSDNFFIRHEPKRQLNTLANFNFQSQLISHSNAVPSAYDINQLQVQQQLQKQSQRSLANQQKSSSTQRQGGRDQKKKKSKVSNLSMGSYNSGATGSKPLMKMNTNISQGSQGDKDESDQEDEIKHLDMEGEPNDDDDDDESNVDDDGDEHLIQNQAIKIEAPEIIKESRAHGHNRMKSLSIQNKTAQINQTAMFGQDSKDSRQSTQKHQSYFGSYNSNNN